MGGVTSAADYEAVNAALGRVVASVPTSKVMDVYNAFAKIVGGTVPNKLFSTVDPLVLQSQVARLTLDESLVHTIPADGVITLFDAIFQQNLAGMTTRIATEDNNS